MYGALIPAMFLGANDPSSAGSEREEYVPMDSMDLRRANVSLSRTFLWRNIWVSVP